MGFGTGVFGVLVGAGGGFIMAPVLRIFFDKDPEIVAGTVLTLVAVNSISGALAYRKRRIVDRRSAYLFALAAIPGSVIAPFALGAALDSLPGIYDVAFGALLVALAARMATQRDVSDRRTTLSRERGRSRRFAPASSLRRHTVTSESGHTYRYRIHEGYAVGMNFLLGFVSSFFGVGAGFLRTPILVYVFGFPVQVAVATSILALSFYTSAGAATYAIRGQVEWFPTLVFGGVGLVVGGQLGAALIDKIQGIWIMRLLMVVILFLGVYLVLLGMGVELIGG